MKFGERLFQTKLLSRLSHKVCRLLSSPVLLHKFTIVLIGTPKNATHIQLFRERLSEKAHATIPIGIVGGLEFTVLQRKFDRLAREAMEICLRVLKESNKTE